MCARRRDDPENPPFEPEEPLEPEKPKASVGPSRIRSKYAALGGASGFLGEPTIPEERPTADGVGCYRHYQHGSIFWAPQADAHEVHGGIAIKWAELGWERSFLGYPITDELATPDGVGRYNLFQHGMIYWTPHQGAMPLAKPLRNISLVKEQSNPQVYFLCGGLKLQMFKDAEFSNVGFRWEEIQIVPDGALAAYRWHHFSAPATIKPSDVFFECGEDFTSITGRWHFNCQRLANLIKKDVVVAGWLVKTPYVNNLSHGVEDIHYDIRLDPDFIDKMYGPGGLSSALIRAVYPGNPENDFLPFSDRAPDGTERGVTYNSFIIARNDVDIHGELNAWHVDNTGGLFTRHFVGRGAAPGGWHHIPFGNDTNVWWPFDVLNPDGGARPLAAGDYIIMKGALWQDSPHEKPEELASDPWHRGVTRGHAGWTEIHPVDWVVRVDEPQPPVRKTVARVCELAEENTTKPFYLEIFPDFAGRSPTKQYTVGKIVSLIDNRFTYLDTLSAYTVENKGNHVVVQGAINGTAGSQGRLKACYIVTWRETDMRDEVWVEDDVPAGATLAGDGEGWNWITIPSSNPGPFSRQRAHQSNSVIGIHQHYFWGAVNPLMANGSDTLFAYVYLDPNDLPYEVMLQWHDGSWEHRAYWGANVIDCGVDGTASRFYMGPIPSSGEWVRLEVQAGLVGLVGTPVNGMAFTLFGGRATWDYAGRCIGLS